MENSSTGFTAGEQAEAWQNDPKKTIKLLRGECIQATLRGENSLDDSSRIARKFLLFLFAGAMISGSAFCQTESFDSLPSAPTPTADVAFYAGAPRFDVTTLPPGTFDQDTNAGQAGGITLSPREPQHHGLVMRSILRTLEDQKELYRAPFKTSNFKWDAVVLAGTTPLLIEDRRIESHIPTSHYTLYQATSDIGIGTLGASLGAVWIYGMKGDHPHAKEVGNLELETLINTFLIYTPMQFIAGRQRPGEGNGHGDFWKHRAIDTSFPGGHAMFTYAMATVVSHEYPQKWVQVLAYTAASTVTVTRFLAHDHWASDMFIGSALGIGIGAHVFHAHCDPELSDSCKHHVRWIF